MLFLAISNSVGDRVRTMKARSSGERRDRCADACSIGKISDGGLWKAESEDLACRDKLSDRCVCAHSMWKESTHCIMG